MMTIPNLRLPLAISLLMLMSAPQSGMWLEMEEAVKQPRTTGSVQTGPRTAAEAEAMERSVRIRKMSRTQSGTRNRQELRLGGGTSKKSTVIVDHLIQKQTGVGNRQTMSLGTSDHQ